MVFSALPPTAAAFAASAGSAASAGHPHAGAPTLDALILAAAGLALFLYIAAAVASRRGGRPWPWHRVGCWCAGVVAAVVAVVGPVADAAHGDFVMHMWAHLLIGMLAPLLLVLAAPVTLALRTLSVTPARRLSRLLRSGPATVIAHPVTALVLSAGGLWVIYRTTVFGAMHANPLLLLVVHAHLLLAGYLFTAALIGLDPAPHAPRRTVQAVVLVLAMASHAVLAKTLYAFPLAGVPVASAHEGAQLMYYAGAFVEAAIIVVFCAQWYRAAGRRVVPGEAAPGQASPGHTAGRLPARASTAVTSRSAG